MIEMSEIAEGGFIQLNSLYEFFGLEEGVGLFPDIFGGFYEQFFWAGRQRLQVGKRDEEHLENFILIMVFERTKNLYLCFFSKFKVPDVQSWDYLLLRHYHNDHD